MRRAAILVVAAFLACREPEKPATPPVPPPAADAVEEGNLLNMSLGASVVSRTAELTLDNSAARAIDGDPAMMWTSPPADNNQTLVFALPVPARIDHVGAQTPPAANFAVKKIRFEVSADGKTFNTVAEPQLTASETPQIFPITPVVASYLRVTTIDAPGRYAMLQGVHARGSFVSPPVAQPIAGCWSINGKPATFVEENGRIRGKFGDVFLQGGVDGALYRLMWVRGPQWGHAAITISPDGKKLTGIKWHEEPIQYNFGESWFGEQCEGPPPAQVPRDARNDTGMDFLQRARRLPLYAGEADLDLVMNLLSEGKRVKLVARDFRGVPQEPKLNALREALQRRGADLSRVELVALGDRNPHHAIQNDLMRSLYGVVEIEP